jgi:hypothetical protein
VAELHVLHGAILAAGAPSGEAVGAIAWAACTDADRFVQVGALMTDAARAVLTLWDRVIALAEQAQPLDWTRPTPDPDMTVRDVVSHVAAGTAIPAGPRVPPAELVEGLRLARAEYEARLAAVARHHRRHEEQHDEPHDATHLRRQLGATCLDLYVHAHDLSTALGVPVDLDDDSPAVTEACQYLLGLTPHLFAGRAGAHEGQTLRVGLPGMAERGPVLAAADGATVTVAGGRGLWRPDATAEGQPDGTDTDGAGVVTAKPAAFVLLLAGRGDPAQWRDRGALEWSGDSGEAFVRKARLFA